MSDAASDAARPLALDLFCGGGGASMGLHRAGFDVIGVDIKRQPRYPFRFVQADALALPFDLRQFAFVWASPVCKAYTRCWRGRPEKRKAHPTDQIDAVRAALLAAGVPFVIENVEGAPLRPDLVLTGAMFDLDVVRNRVFEFGGMTPPFALSRQHRGTASNGDLAVVVGGGCQSFFLKRRPIDPVLKARLYARNCKAGWSAAMGIDWMTRAELSQAIPPAYAEFIGSAAISALATKAPL